MDSLVSGTVELVLGLCATIVCGLTLAVGNPMCLIATILRCVVVEEIDRSPLANSMPIRVSGRCTLDWSSQNIGSYVEVRFKDVFWYGIRHPCLLPMCLLAHIVKSFVCYLDLFLFVVVRECFAYFVEYLK